MFMNTFDYPYPDDGGDLYDVLDRSDDARKRFMSLPSHVRQRLERQPELISEADDLADYGEEEY
ncbi:MAG: hypothetical protein J6L81_05665 [Clostridia bacterium]|nr:hypothetical protein [Clostridia bacterium]